MRRELCEWVFEVEHDEDKGVTWLHISAAPDQDGVSEGVSLPSKDAVPLLGALLAAMADESEAA